MFSGGVLVVLVAHAEVRVVSHLPKGATQVRINGTTVQPKAQDGEEETADEEQQGHNSAGQPLLCRGKKYQDQSKM